MNIVDRTIAHTCFLTFLFIVMAVAVDVRSQTVASRTFSDFLSGSRSSTSSEITADTKSKADIIERLCPINDNVVALRLLSEYGAVFAASDSILLPQRCFFADAASARKYQAKLQTWTAIVSGISIPLQEPAAKSLLNAVEECQPSGTRVRPLDGAIAGARTYEDTVRIWNTRFFRALDRWSASGKIDPAASIKVRNEPLVSQLRQLIDWEDQGLWFGTSLTGSIFSSTAPPGASQHLLLVAFDVEPPVTEKLVSIFNKNGWYQTVRGDANHFTYLGLPEADLPGRGLTKITFRGRDYWVPALPGTFISRSN